MEPRRVACGTAILLVCAWWTAGSAVAGGTRIVLKDAVLLDKASYQLGDLAEIHASDAATATLLADVAMDAAPSSATPTLVSRRRLVKLVRAQLPHLHRDIRWEGAEVVAVKRLTAPYSRTAIVEFAERQLHAHLKPHVDSLTLHALPRRGAVQVPSGAVELRVAAGLADAPSRRMLVPVEVWVDGAFVRAVPVWFAVTAVQEVLVAAAELPAGSRPESNDFVPAKVEVTALPGIPLAASVDLVGQRLKRRVDAGGALLQGYLEPAPEVARGEQVVFAYAEGLIRIEGKARALSDGRVGQNVHIRSGNDTLLATVVAPGQVSVTPR